MEKRYQVFISSTFYDLKEERQAVLKAILELDHMPGGMELFPASDESAWRLIQDVIDASDYYVLIIGGRYGSLDEAGLGYTEKEYDYAIQAKKPIIPLLHENPDNLPRGKTETDGQSWEKLKSFRSKVEKRHTCVYWKSVEDLKAKVIIGLTTAIKRSPAVGWVRADQVPSGATVTDVLKLRNRISELEKEAEESNVTPPKGTEDLEQGDDCFGIPCTFCVEQDDSDEVHLGGEISLTWNEIFAAVAPTMINEAKVDDLKSAFRSFFIRSTLAAYKKGKYKNHEFSSFHFPNEKMDTCIIQFRALGLIKESNRQRSIKDTQTYWSLTPYGDYVMTQLRALRRETSTNPERQEQEA